MAKTDSRVIENEKRIRKAYFTLLKKQPLNKITVTKICDVAEINRGTFYNHYIDIYDLAEKVENEYLDKFCAMVKENMLTKNESKAYITKILRRAKDNDFVGLMMSSSLNHESFMRRLSGECSALLLQFWEDSEITGLTDSEKSMYYHYISGGTGSIIRYWLESGMQEDPDLVADRIVKLTDNTVKMLKEEA